MLPSCWDVVLPSPPVAGQQLPVQPVAVICMLHSFSDEEDIGQMNPHSYSVNDGDFRRVEKFDQESTMATNIILSCLHELV